MTFGIDLDGALTADDPRDFIFVEDATATGTLDLSASNINASARFGFVNVDVVNGSGNAAALMGAMVMLIFGLIMYRTFARLTGGAKKAT